MFSALGWGWGCTLLALVALVAVPAPVVVSPPCMSPRSVGSLTSPDVYLGQASSGEIPIPWLSTHFRHHCMASNHTVVQSTIDAIPYFDEKEELRKAGGSPAFYDFDVARCHPHPPTQHLQAGSRSQVSQNSSPGSPLSSCCSQLTFCRPEPDTKSCITSHTRLTIMIMIL